VFLEARVAEPESNIVADALQFLLQQAADTTSSPDAHAVAKRLLERLRAVQTGDDERDDV
jgi:flagellar hook-associated protein FlgK